MCVDCKFFLYIFFVRRHRQQQEENIGNELRILEGMKRNEKNKAKKKNGEKNKLRCEE